MVKPGASKMTDYLAQKYGDLGDKKKRQNKSKKEKDKSKKEKNRRRKKKDSERIHNNSEDDEELDRTNHLDSSSEEGEEDGPVVVEDAVRASFRVDPEQDAVGGEPDQRLRKRHGRDESPNNNREGSSSPPFPSDRDGGRRQHRRRYDSDDEDSSDSYRGRHVEVKRRYDSDDNDDEDEPEGEAQSGRGERRGGGDLEARRDEARRKRSRTARSSDDDHHHPHTRRERGDVPSASPDVSSSSSSDHHRRTRERRRYDSDEEEGPNGQDNDPGSNHHPRRRYDSEDDEDGDPKASASSLSRSRRKMESGHAAGLQSSRAFADAEAELYRARRRQAQEMVDEHGMGETTYRDRRSGRSSRDVVDVSFEKLQQQQQVLLNQGRVQREAMERHQQEMAVLATSSFSRYENDEELEALRRSAIREGDPMAASSAALAAKTLSGSGVSSSAFPTASRPVYKGPPPKPNRFGIRPGFRWDGEDRGNGFEDRLLARRYSQQHQRELSYRLSSTDM